MSPTHAFVVCAYKENPYLPETIESLKNQTVQSPITVSTSTPSDYLERVCEEHQVPLIINRNLGRAGDDWNYAYNSMDADLVTIAHQDDFYEPNYLERILAKYTSDSSIIFTDYYELRDGKRVDSNSLLNIKRVMNAPLRIGPFNNSQFVKRRMLSLGCAICCPAVTFHKPITGESVFDTKFINSCDYKTWVDLASKPGRFVYIPEKLLGHRIYAESATSLNLENDIRKKEDLEILESLWPSFIAKAINKAYAQSEKSNTLD